MPDWIRMSDKKPERGEKVWYFFYITGVNAGTYDVIEGYDCFYGKNGFLCDDVTHWKPRGNCSFIPPVPPEKRDYDYENRR